MHFVPFSVVEHTEFRYLLQNTNYRWYNNISSEMISMELKIMSDEVKNYYLKKLEELAIVSFTTEVWKED